MLGCTERNCKLKHAPSAVHDACIHHAVGKYINPETNGERVRLTGAAPPVWSLYIIKPNVNVILLHTSFKLRFNEHIITFSPTKLKQFQRNPFAHSIYLGSHIIIGGFERHLQTVKDSLRCLNFCSADKRLSRKQNRTSEEGMSAQDIDR